MFQKLLSSLSYLYSQGLSKTYKMQIKIDLISKQLEEEMYEASFQNCQIIKKKYRRKTPRQILYLGSCALFALGHIHQSEEWVEGYGETSRKDALYFYLKAYIELHRKKVDEALLSWTSILQIDPSEILADQLIERLKRHEKEVLSEINHSENFHYYVPIHVFQNFNHESRSNSDDTKGYINVFKIFFFNRKVLVSLLFLNVFGFLGFKYSYIFLTPKVPLIPSPQSGSVVPLERYEKERPIFIFKDSKQVVLHFERARNLIENLQVNQGRVLLSQIENSNASFEFIERAKLLREAIPILQLKNFKDNISIEELSQAPHLYNEAQIFWTASLRAIKPNSEGLELELEPNSKSNIKLSLYYFASPAKKKKIIAYLSTKKVIRFLGIFKEKKEEVLRIQALEFLIEE